MTQALFTSMTGLNAGTEQLTVVSDNVANMNTTAYKTSRVDFQDIWYATKTTGTNSSRVSGGTNPYQIGVGVQCASISKDFGAASTNTTGRASDMAITGNGWFTVQNSDGKVLLTRDGTFSLDENGFLCTADGSKVLGMDEMESLTNSTTPIKMPTSIKVVTEGTPKAKFDAMKVSELNSLGSSNSGIRDGEFEVVVKVKNADDTVSTINLKVNVGDQVNDGSVAAMVAAMNASTTTVTNEDGSTTTYNVSDYLTVASEDGVISFTPKDNVESLEFKSIEEKDGGTNFVSIAKLANMPLVGGKYTTNPLNLSATIGQVDDITSEYTQNYDSFSVGKDGLVTVTYGDGSILTVKANEDGSTYFSYQTSGGVIINDDIQNSGNASLYVDPNVLVKANMQLQMAKVLNDGGLVAEGNNQYSIGVNCGDVIYTAANINGVGAVVTGALEASNVDLAQQFSNMILAQRLVQANSQVFSGANQLLETLVYLGQ
ncbi:MAG: flagellar hook-basal body complex protein [Candidatus Gastranaerophilales bacterium]|nr:flagellar hook-basal body complex protein [Candidatus Gastranaerophilales bacterium]